MILFDKLSIRLRLLVMVGIGAISGLILLSTALYSLNTFRNDTQLVAHDVERSTHALTLVSGAQNAFQAQLRGLKDMVIRNFMPEEFEKAQKEFLAERAKFWQQIEELEKIDAAGTIKGNRESARNPPAGAGTEQAVRRCNRRERSRHAQIYGHGGRRPARHRAPTH